MNDMRLPRLIITAAMLLTVVVSHGARAQQPALQEAEQLRQQINELSGTGRRREAIALAERALALEEVALGPEDPLIVGAIRDLGVVYYWAAEYAKADWVACIPIGNWMPLGNGVEPVLQQ
jgi:hypothetical protein